VSIDEPTTVQTLKLKVSKINMIISALTTDKNKSERLSKTLLEPLFTVALVLLIKTSQIIDKVGEILI
jgi:hypothetical protein